MTRLYHIYLKMVKITRNKKGAIYGTDRKVS
nr:MAG TPA: hypothetical protein [Caudoviricetes sp.]